MTQSPLVDPMIRVATPASRPTPAEAHDTLTAPGAMFEMETILRRKRSVRAWRNGPKTPVDLRASAALYAPHPFLVYEEGRTSYDAFRRAASALAKALIERGIEKGDRIAIVMRNQSEWPIWFYGAALAGAIVSPLNAWWSAEEIAFALTDSGARIAIFDDDRFARIHDILHTCGNLRHTIVSRCAGYPGDPETIRTHAAADEGRFRRQGLCRARVQVRGAECRPDAWRHRSDGRTPLKPLFQAGDDDRESVWIGGLPFDAIPGSAERLNEPSNEIAIHDHEEKRRAP